MAIIEKFSATINGKKTELCINKVQMRSKKKYFITVVGSPERVSGIYNTPEEAKGIYLKLVK